MNKQVLDVQQMQHLQELGLELDYNTMLSWIVDERGKDKPLLCISSEAVDYVDFSHYCLPAYTLQDVLDELPKEISKEGCTWYASLYIDFENDRIAYGNTDRYGFEIYHEIMIEEDFIDSAYSMLVWCIKNGFVKIGKEYKL